MAVGRLTKNIFATHVPGKAEADVALDNVLVIFAFFFRPRSSSTGRALKDPPRRRSQRKEPGPSQGWGPVKRTSTSTCRPSPPRSSSLGSWLDAHPDTGLTTSFLAVVYFLRKSESSWPSVFLTTVGAKHRQGGYVAFVTTNCRWSHRSGSNFKLG